MRGVTDTAAAKAHRDHASNLQASFSMPAVEISNDLSAEDICIMLRDLDRLRWHIEDLFGYQPYIISDNGVGVAFERPVATALRALAEWVARQMEQCHEALKRASPTDRSQRKERLAALMIIAVDKGDMDALEKYADEAKSLR